MPHAPHAFIRAARRPHAAATDLTTASARQIARQHSSTKESRLIDRIVRAIGGARHNRNG